MDARSLDLLREIDESLSWAWTMVDNEIRLEVADQPGMMHASVTVNDGTVSVVEFDGWAITGQYVFSGSPDVVARRVVTLLDSIAAERA